MAGTAFMMKKENVVPQLTAEQLIEAETVKFEVDFSIPSFEIELMKLKLAPGGKMVARPAVFEQWVNFAMIGMSLWYQKREHDTWIKS